MNEVRFSRQVKEVKFGAWTLDPKKQCIYDGSTERELEPLLFRLLCYFIINNEQIITRQDLVDDVWCQKYVDDNAINRAMSELRKTLKSDEQKGIVVKTHYRKGYSFFLEPEIIYHKELTDEESKAPPVKLSIEEKSKPRRKPNARNGKLLTILSIVLLVVVCYALFSNYSYRNDDLEISNRDIEEKVLSWVPGRYAQLRLSYNKKLLAFSFAPQDTKYYSLVVKELDSGYERRLGDEGVHYYPLGWSTDSSVLYYRAKTDKSCQIWQINADFSKGNTALFDCSMRGLVTGSGVSKDRIIYSKSGYRNRDELSVLTSRDLKTGEEFQISSPNLNSYGDQFLTYIPEKEVVIFERRQYDTNELYMTDPDGGDQIKLLESQSRIWSVNYDAESDLLLWFDNKKNIVYGYSLSQRKLVKKDQLNTSQNYAIFQFIDKNEMLIVSYPFISYVYTLNLNEKVMNPDIQLSLDSINPIKFKQGYMVLTEHGGGRVVTKVANSGKSDILDIPSGDIRNIRYDEQSDLLLVHHRRKIEIYKYSDLSLLDTITAEGAIISAEFLSDDEIGYVVLGEQKVKSNSYKYSLKFKKNTFIPALNSLWIGRLDAKRLISLSSNDIVVLYDINSGKTVQEFDLPKAIYRHSISVGNGYIYHSDGKRIYRIDPDIEGSAEEVYVVEESKYVIRDISYASHDETIWMNIIETNENQLLDIKIKEEVSK
ncbi:transcriptional regulator [Pseudoalteromonas sp. JBTF-M23]|uniref:Transcriptional regulator n=1 Tax=Pseudoalteromonas caenipelagi TaxID=2726988 RepID=A0A849VFP7_9GAMM|nr:winged helix-turn-helix domain-containing protein [Pseudoalteromonas caenipelagi]NOU51333.1 transcriptional regulator [Pseudoalteromonas caenipelagi]